jgi:extradiol dioxygenase family protein
MPELPRFHLAFPVHDLEAARRFYVDVMGARLGRESARWIDFDFFGHQITAHLSPGSPKTETNPVDGDDVPVRHFGAVLDWAEWEKTAERLRAAGVRFLIEPHVRFAGQVGEQATLFLLDPSDNAIELKAFRRPDDVFAR